jgi:hypothetical protein
MLSGKRHKDGGVKAIVDGSEMVELEGGEYIMSRDAVRRHGVEKLNKMNFGGMTKKNKPKYNYKEGGELEANQAFKQGVRYMGYGGETTMSNYKDGGLTASCGDIVNVHEHSGYKAGE